MKPLVPLALAAALLAAPLHAQEEGPSLLDQGRDLFLRGLTEEIAPQIEGLSGIAAEYLPTFTLLAREMGPAFVEVFGRIDAIGNYEPPEILPNGDILLRRSPDAPEWTPPEADPGAVPDPEAPQVEL
ncbi:hypothetical protein [Rubellimicrobium roseum]|nr:hypothetical protein [Rubellimicrobium roseum]